MKRFLLDLAGFLVVAVLCAGGVYLLAGCTEKKYYTTTSPCCEDACVEVHTCDSSQGCTDGCSFENVILCFNGETIKVPLSEKKKYTEQGATVGKCKKTPPGDDDDDCDPCGDDDDDDPPCVGPCCPDPWNKVTICHFPPGNPENAHTIRIGASAVPAHLNNHPGDHCGPCQ